MLNNYQVKARPSVLLSYLKVLFEYMEQIECKTKYGINRTSSTHLFDDGKIFAHFLPANITSLIHPMDHGVLKAIKTIYRNKLIRRLIIEGDVGKSIVEFSEYEIVEFVAESWSDIQPLTLRRSWQKVIAMDSLPKQTKSVCDGIPTVLADALQEGDEHDTMSSDPVFVNPSCKGCALWHGIRIRQEKEKVAADQDDLCDVSEFQCLFQELGLNIDTTQATVMTLAVRC